jgi:HK97 family phage major capsid protein
VTAEATGMTGTGAGQPLGLFVASNDGIPTTRDVATGNTQTAMTFDGLINAKYSVKSQYWRNASWIMHRDGAKMLRKIKDGDGQYIWHPSLQAGEPDMLLDRPLLMSEYAPNTFTAGLYVGIFGDLKFYKWAIALDMEMQRLLELYAATSQVGFVGRMEIDGMPALAEAFARVTLAP